MHIFSYTSFYYKCKYENNTQIYKIHLLYKLLQQMISLQIFNTNNTQHTKVSLCYSYSQRIAEQSEFLYYWRNVFKKKIKHQRVNHLGLSTRKLMKLCKSNTHTHDIHC